MPPLASKERLPRSPSSPIRPWKTFCQSHLFRCEELHPRRVRKQSASGEAVKARHRFMLFEEEEAFPKASKKCRGLPIGFGFGSVCGRGFESGEFELKWRWCVLERLWFFC